MADYEKPQVIGRWWNGHWGTMARRDIRLTRQIDGTLLLEWWGDKGLIDDRKTYPAGSTQALLDAHALIDKDGGDGWKDML
jgi:hypothetical protein